jgi:hypothetical protein
MSEQRRRQREQARANRNAAFGAHFGMDNKPPGDTVFRHPQSVSYRQTAEQAARMNHIAEMRKRILQQLEEARQVLLLEKVWEFAKANYAKELEPMRHMDAKQALAIWCKDHRLDLIGAAGQENIHLVQIDHKGIGAIALRHTLDPVSGQSTGMTWVWLTPDQIHIAIDSDTAMHTDDPFKVE